MNFKILFTKRVLIYNHGRMVWIEELIDTANLKFSHFSFSI